MPLVEANPRVMDEAIRAICANTEVGVKFLTNFYLGTIEAVLLANR